MAEGIEIVLDRPRRVRYTWGDLKALQQRLSKPVGEIVADLGKLDVNAIQHLLFAGLHHEDARLRFDDVGGLIEKYVDGGKTLGDVLWVVNEALTQSGFFGREAGRTEAPPAS